MYFHDKRNKQFFRKVLCLFLTIFSLSSCKNIDTIDKNYISVMIEQGEGFVAYDPIKSQERGTDFSFQIKLEDNYYISSINYDLYRIETENEYTIVTLEKVMFPMVITLNTSKDYVIYHSDGGKFFNGRDFLRHGKNENHLQFNTLSGHEILKKENYLLTGWEDLNNNHIGLGSRCDRKIKHLKAKRIRESSLQDFIFEKNNDGYSIKEYKGNDEIVILPSFYQEYKINDIKSGAFNDLRINELYLNPYIESIGEMAFNNCSIKKIIFFDNLKGVNDTSFLNCDIRKIHINATRKPRYSGTFFDTFSDKMDYLKLIKDKKKIILFSGSSTRYGYDSALMKKYFPKYEVVNMGVYAYFSAKIQLDIIKNFLLPGDIIIDAPEFDAVAWQMFDEVSFEKRVFNMFESNYQNLQYIDISDYGNFFESFEKFQLERDTLPPKSYEVSAMHLDDEGNNHENEIYNINGDFILQRDGEVKEGLISQHRLAYTIGQIKDKQYESFDAVYNEMKRKDINFFFNYAPRNIDSLTTNSTKENRKLFEEQINEKIKAPFLSTMDDFLYPADHFYLIDNHLTTEGARKRTIVTAENLKKYIY